MAAVDPQSQLAASPTSPPGGLAKEKLPELRSLTGARFVAAVTVVLGHYLEGKPTPPLIAPIVGSGPASVCFFYILSGFILTYNYGQKNIDWLLFFRARLARVYPVYLLGLLLGVINYAFIYHVQWSSILVFAVTVDAFCLQDWIARPVFHGFNTPSWSISCEMLFYSIFPFVVAWLTKRRKSLRWIVCSACVIFLIEGLAFGVLTQVVVALWRTPGLPHADMPFNIAVDLIAYRMPLDPMWGVPGWHCHRRRLLKRAPLAEWRHKRGDAWLTPRFAAPAVRRPHRQRLRCGS